MSDYQYGVYYVGRDLGWQWFDTLGEARDDLAVTDDKYLPGHIGRRKIGEPEYLNEARV
jgi:hypothetical protein